MQVSVENTGTLARRMTVALPSGDVDTAVEARLRSLSKTARLNGFRPGKVPFKVVKKRFEPQVRSEVLGSLINRSLQDAIRQEKLRLAGQPEIEAVDENVVTTLPAAGGDAETEGQAGGSPAGESVPGFSYTATFEVYPEFEPAYGSDLAVTRPVVEIGEADVDEMIDSLRKQRTSYDPVERAAVDGDQLVIDFTGIIEGEKFEGGAAEKAPLVLGSNSMIPGFEAQLIGVAAGDDRTIQVDFPADYQAEHLAGKQAAFDIHVHEVREARLPELDAELVRSFGIEDGEVDSLKADIRKNMTRELKQRVDGQIKGQIMEGLVTANPIDVPEALVKEEIGRQREQLMRQMPEGTDASFLSDDIFREQSVKRVRLGLVVGEIIRRDGLKAEAGAVREEIERLASSYQDPQEVIDHYYGNPELLRNIEGLVLEGAVTDRVLAAATITDETRTFKDIMNPPAPGADTGTDTGTATTASDDAADESTDGNS